MRGPHNIWRLIRTGATMERTGAMAVALDAVDAPKLVRVGLRGLVWPFKWLGYKGDLGQPPITRALTALGPAYIKFGQILSTRPDIVGEEMSTQLRVLQDKLPPFSLEIAKATVRQELGRPVAEIFSEFSEPVAAASIAQVHRARRTDTGVEVAVKVLRPGIEQAFQRDIDAFYLAAWVIEFLSPSARRLRARDVIAHFEGVVLGELDLRLESASAAEFAANTKKDAGFQVPPVEWDLSAKRVMTLGWGEGIAIHELDALDAAGHDRSALGANVMKLFLSHALRDGYFHADMHQGNLKVAANGDIIALDFGIMGHIDDYTRRAYAEILYGFTQRDFRRVAQVHFEAGYVPANQDVEEFSRALRAMGEPIFGVSADQVSMARLFSYLFEVTERFGMQTRTELILLQRTMVVVEGVARSLDPGINIWDVAKPVIERYIQENIGPKAILRDLVQTIKVLSRFGPKLPEMAEAALIRQSAMPGPVPVHRPFRAVAYVVLGAGLATAGYWLVSLL